MPGKVSIGQHRQIRWSDDVELCPHAIDMKLTGKTFTEYAATSSTEPAHTWDQALLRHHHS
jgi:hypothetical protein